MNSWFFQPVGGTTLGLFRIFFGMLMAIEFFRFKMALVGFFQTHYFRFTYDYFHWIEPLPTNLLEVFFWLMIVNSVLFAAGVAYRITSVIQFLGFFYAFHLEASMYNNHFYLFILVCFIMVFCSADRDYSVKAFRLGATKIPKWNLLALQGQLFILYFYGGIAKLNPEWLLYAQPVRSWLPNMLHDSLGIQELSEERLTALSFVIAYSGLMIDLLAGPLLLWKKTRTYMIVFLLLFHAMNSQMFQIGLFPWFGIGSLILFVDPSKIPPLTAHMGDAKRVVRPMVKWLFAIYFMAQCLIPLRHWVAPGWVLWGEKGFSFSWFMKLRSKLTIDSIRVKIDGDPNTYYINTHDYVMSDQASLMVFTPYTLVQFAHKLEERLKEEKGITEDIQIYAEIYAKLHDHPYQLFIDPKQDLTLIPYKNVGLFESQDWVFEFNPNAVEPPFEFLRMGKTKKASTSRPFSN